MHWYWLRGIFLLLLTLWTSFAYAESIKVAVAANFASPMKTLVAEFEKASGHQVSLSFASTGKFYAQILNGAPFHAFFSADQTTPEKLLAEGKAIADSRFTYAIGALALWSAKSELFPEPLTHLKKGGFNKLALANPKLAPYGTAAVEVLAKLALTDATQEKWVQGENIAQTFQFVATGNADLGFVALSQIMQEDAITQGSYWLVPADLHSPIRQDAVILEPGKNSRATEQLMVFMRSPVAQTIIQSYGYQTAGAQ